MGSGPPGGLQEAFLPQGSLTQKHKAPSSVEEDFLICTGKKLLLVMASPFCLIFLSRKEVGWAVWVLCRPPELESSASVITEFLPVTWGLRVTEAGAARYPMFYKTIIMSFSLYSNQSFLYTCKSFSWLPSWYNGKESTCQCRRCRHGFDPWVKKILWRRKWQATPVCLPGESHGQRSLLGYSPWGRKELNLTEHAHMQIIL